MSELNPTGEQPAAAEPSRPPSPGPEDLDTPPNATSNNSDCSNGLGSQLTGIQELLAEVRKLTQALNNASEWSNNQTSEMPTERIYQKSLAFRDELFEYILPELKGSLESHPDYRNIRRQLGDLEVTQRNGTKHLFLRLLEDPIFLDFWEPTPGQLRGRGFNEMAAISQKKDDSYTLASRYHQAVQQWIEMTWPAKMSNLRLRAVQTIHSPGQTSNIRGSQNEDPPQSSCFGSLW